MKLIYQPLKFIWINQQFGANEVCINNAGNIIGCDGLNPPEGYRSIYGARGHLGVDLSASSSMNIYNAQRGTVYYIDTNIKSGYDIRIESEIDGRKLRHIYEHLSVIDPTMKKGEWVETGKVIGKPGNTGYSNGVHLHFQVEELINGVWTPIDPMTVMNRTVATKVLVLNNSIQYASVQLAILKDSLRDYFNSLKTD